MNEVEIMQDIRDDFLEEHEMWNDMHAYNCVLHVTDAIMSELNDEFVRTDERRDIDACR